MHSLHPPASFSLPGTNIFLSTPFSNTLTPCSSLTITYQVSHPYKAARKVIVLGILIFYIIRWQSERQKILERKAPGVCWIWYTLTPLIVKIWFVGFFAKSLNTRHFQIIYYNYNWQPTRCNYFDLLISNQLYMFRAMFSPIFRSISL